MIFDKSKYSEIVRSREANVFEGNYDKDFFNFSKSVFSGHQEEGLFSANSSMIKNTLKITGVKEFGPKQLKYENNRNEKLIGSQENSIVNNPSIQILAKEKKESHGRTKSISLYSEKIISYSDSPTKLKKRPKKKSSSKFDVLSDYSNTKANEKDFRTNAGLRSTGAIKQPRSKMKDKVIKTVKNNSGKIKIVQIKSRQLF